MDTRQRKGQARRTVGALDKGDSILKGKFLLNDKTADGLNGRVNNDVDLVQTFLEIVDGGFEFLEKRWEDGPHSENPKNRADEA